VYLALLRRQRLQGRLLIDVLRILQRLCHTSTILFQQELIARNIFVALLVVQSIVKYVASLDASVTQNHHNSDKALVVRISVS